MSHADTGALFSWHAFQKGYCALSVDSSNPLQPNPQCQATVNTLIDNHLTTTAGTAIAADVIWQPSVSTPFAAVSPVLQLADGSFVGSAGFSPNMVAFDAAGNTRWVVPGYNPQMATADGSVIGQAGSVFDPGTGSFIPGPAATFDPTNGSASGRLTALPQYSWKGAYQLGSVEAVVASPLNLLTSFLAVLGGNLSGNGTSEVHHSIGLFWCGGGHGGQGSCSQDPLNVGGVDTSYSYKHSTDSNFGDLQDFSVAHPDWVDTIQSSALTALQKAFRNFPVRVERASLSTHTSFLDCAPSLHCTLPDQEHLIVVTGDQQPSGTGLTINQTVSRVYYIPAMSNAQDNGATGLSPSYPPSTPQDLAAFQVLTRAIGIGIGNSAAHELGHQMAFKVILIMDCSEPNANRPCASGDNNVFEYYGAQPFQYTHVFPDIHWQTPNSICAIHQFFEKAYRNNNENCTASFTK